MRENRGWLHMYPTEEELNNTLSSIIERLTTQTEQALWKHSASQEKSKAYILYAKWLDSQSSLKAYCYILEQMLKEKYYPNATILNTMIHDFGCVNSEYAIHIYELSRTHGLANTATYNATLSILLHKTEKRNTDLIIQLLREAKTNGLANHLTHDYASKVISTCLQSDSAIQIHELAKAYELENTATYNAVIHKLSQSPNQNIDNVALSLSLLDETIEKKIISSYIYHLVIEIVRKNAPINLDLVMSLLDEASKKKLVNSYVYNSTLNALAKSPYPNIAIALFILNEAVKTRLANTVTYNIILEVIFMNSQPDADLALKLLKEAEEKKLANAITYFTAIDVLVKAKKLTQARSIFYSEFKNTIFESLVFKKEHGMHVIDLHGHSFGTAYITLHHILSSRPRNMKLSDIQIIYGKGIHTKNHTQDNIHVLKLVVQTVLKDLNIQGIEDMKNSGRIRLSGKQASTSMTHTKLFLPSKAVGKDKSAAVTPVDNPYQRLLSV
jgi:hypothetical protein